MALLKKCPRIDDRTKYAVYGWIRKCEQQLQLQNVPKGIADIIILYYRKAEIFDIIDGEGIKLSDDQTSVTFLKLFNGASFYNSYGLNEISSMNKNKYKWDLRISNFKEGSLSYIWIGISSTYEIQPDAFSRMKGWCYIASFDGSGYTTDHMGATTKIPFGKGDKVTFILDLGKETLTLMVNDNIDKSYCFENIKKDIDIKYRLMVTLNGKNNGVQVEHFEKML